MANYQELWDCTEALYDTFRTARVEAELAGHRNVDALLQDCMDDLEYIETRLERKGAKRHCLVEGCDCQEDEREVGVADVAAYVHNLPKK